MNLLLSGRMKYIGKEYLLRALSNYVSADTLAEFMDDLAMERV
jgi:hypothetical protein